MEIKAQLAKPYTNKQRYEFIVKYNHNLSYTLEETETHLNALGYTEEELQQQETKQRAKEFFNTSLGYIKRKVTMVTGEIKDFLFDILPTLQVGIPIITYNLDGTQNRGVTVTKEFLDECKNQIYFDFYGSLPTIEENSESEESSESV